MTHITVYGSGSFSLRDTFTKVARKLKYFFLNVTKTLISKMTFNLFFSLPSIIQSEIYQYDDTYRIFGNGDFQEELSTAYLRTRVSFKKCYAKITEYVQDLINQGNTCWSNKYGRIGPDNQFKTSHLPTYHSPEDFLIVTHYYYDVLYFKILPKDACYENCDFFHNIFHDLHIYDGYFRNQDTNYVYHGYNKNISKKVLDELCVRNTIMINTYNMRGQFIQEQIALYFVL
jgi:hypothetical protein